MGSPSLAERHFVSRRLRACIFFCLLIAARYALADPVPPFSLNLSGLGNFTVTGTTVAGGLNYPYGLALAADGSLLFGSSTPKTSGGIEGGASVGSVWMLPAQGGSFGAPRQVIGGLVGPVTAVRSTSSGLTLVESGAASDRRITFYDQSYQQIGALNFSYPTQDWDHSTGMSFAVQQPGGSVLLYFIVGSQADQAKTTLQVSATGLFSATLNADSVYLVTLQFDGKSVQASGPPRQVATGLRNPYGLSLDSAGNFIIGDDGQDGSHVVNELGADTLNVVPASNIGKVIYDFGFPDSYVDFATGKYVKGDPNATPPLAAFVAVANTNGAPQYAEGLSAMAFAPSGSLPFAGSRGGEIVTFHGVKDAFGAANYDDALLYYDFASGVDTPIVDSRTAGIGHLDSVLVSGDTLFLADFASNGVVDGIGGNQTGAIYAFKVVSTKVIQPLPSIVTGGVLNAASFAKDAQGNGTAVAPGSLVAIFGNFPGATAASAASIPYGTSLGGISVTFNGILAPLQATAPSGAFPFITAQIPFEVLSNVATPGTAQVVVTVNQQSSLPITTPIVPSAPGIFTIPATGQGNAVLVFVDTKGTATIAAPTNANLGFPTAPMPRGASGFFYATGLGAVSPPIGDGSGGIDGIIHEAILKPIVTIGGISTEVDYSGPSGFPGVYQINIVVPQGAPTGDGIPLIVSTFDGSVIGNTAKVSIR